MKNINTNHVSFKSIILFALALVIGLVAAPVAAVANDSTPSVANNSTYAVLMASGYYDGVAEVNDLIANRAEIERAVGFKLSFRYLAQVSRLHAAIFAQIGSWGGEAYSLGRAAAFDEAADSNGEPR